jgi:CrcB protein
LDDKADGLPVDPDIELGTGDPPAAVTKRSREHHSQVAIVVAVGIGGACGAVARYAVSLGIPSATAGFPWSTFVINVTGSAFLGLLLVVLVEQFPRGRLTRPIVATGVIGAYTTFSTFEIDAVNLVRAGHPTTAVIYVTASVIAGLVAVWAGMTGARALLQIERQLQEEM